jgi:hypothetical protein
MTFNKCEYDLVACLREARISIWEQLQDPFMADWWRTRSVEQLSRDEGLPRAVLNAYRCRDYVFLTNPDYMIGSH